MTSSLVVEDIQVLARGETNSIDIDWGENTAGSETGVLKNGDTVSSATVSVDSKPPGASDPTLGSVSVNGSTLYVNRRPCSAGEATTCSCAIGSTAVAGIYQLKFTATTASGKIIPRFVRVRVDVPTVPTQFP